MINDLRVILPASSLKFQIFRKNILHFMERAKTCCSNRSRGVYPLNQGHMTQLPLSVNKLFYTPPPPSSPTTSGLGTPLLERNF